jgi:hypothetical protein
VTHDEAQCYLHSPGNERFGKTWFQRGDNDQNSNTQFLKLKNGMTFTEDNKCWRHCFSTSMELWIRSSSHKDKL